MSLLAIVAVLLASCVVPGRRTKPDPIPPRPSSVVIGAFNFSESRVIAELYRAALEASGIPAVVADNVASREIMEPALEQGEVDFVPEYLGTALVFLNGPFFGSRATALSQIRAAFSGRGVSVLEPSPGQNRNEIVVLREFAEQHDLRKIGDLRDLAGRLTFGGPPECPSRPLCLQGLENAYGLSFRSFLPLDPGGPATVAALVGKEVEVALLFTTNPALNNERFVVLKDNADLQPPENIVPVVRTEVLERHGSELEDVSDAVTAGLTDHSLRILNQKIGDGDETIEEIAETWLRARGLL